MTSNADGQSASNDASEISWEKLGITPLMRAARAGDSVDTADEAGWTALMGAAAEGHEQIVQLLIDHGENVDAESFDTATALHAATANGVPV